MRTARDASEALTALGKKQPHIMLIDLMLPGTDGLELARRIYARWSVPIIATSASHSLLRQADGLAFINETIRKPFDWEMLVNDLQNCAA